MLYQSIANRKHSKGHYEDSLPWRYAAVWTFSHCVDYAPILLQEQKKEDSESRLTRAHMVDLCANLHCDLAACLLELGKFKEALVHITCCIGLAVPLFGALSPWLMVPFLSLSLFRVMLPEIPHVVTSGKASTY